MAIPQLLLQKEKDYNEDNSLSNLFLEEETYFKDKSRGRKEQEEYNLEEHLMDNLGQSHIQFVETNLIEFTVTKFLTLQNQIEIYHWFTKKHAFHEALGETYDSLNSLIDDFIEVLISNRGRENIDLCKDITINLNLEYQEENILKCIDCCINCIKECIYCEIKEDESELKAILDEILVILSKLKYLLGMS